MIEEFIFPYMIYFSFCWMVCSLIILIIPSIILTIYVNKIYAISYAIPVATSLGLFWIIWCILTLCCIAIYTNYDECCLFFGNRREDTTLPT